MDIERFKREKLESLVALIKMKEHPSECINLDQRNNKWNYLIKGPEGATNRQEFQNTFYFISGNFYLATINSLKKFKGYMHENTSFYISENKYFVDIDEPDDLEFAKSQIYRLRN